MIFIETREFTEWVSDYLSDEALADLQKLLLVDPDTGVVIPGCGGLRKIRMADATRGKGKRGGARVIYLHVPELDRIHLVTVYGKGQKDDLTLEEKRLYSQLVKVLKQNPRQPKGS
jgi:hypothetical protein